MAEKKKQRATKAYKPGKHCPKCGVGNKLGVHKDRLSCGKCGYLERIAKA
jgi:small subunit ribosomal protein S27Ae